MKKLHKQNLPTFVDENLNPFSYCLIYIYTRPEYPEYCKIGKASLSSILKNDKLSDNCSELKKAAERRISQQTKTSSVKYDLRYTSLAIKNGKTFSDYDFHDYLERCGIKKDSPEKDAEGKNIGNEWFKIDYERATKYLVSYKNDEKVIEQKIRKELRPEQLKAVNETINAYNRMLANQDNKSEGKMLWNAIMRFGKTFTAYSFIEKFNLQEKNNKIKKILILTHRPDVNGEWFNEYKDSFLPNNKEYEYSSKRKFGIKWENVDKTKPFFTFLSIQDLRGKQAFESNNYVDDQISENDLIEFKKNNKEYFDINWDLIIVDEAHEGNMTDLANQMHIHLKRKFTLYLSGTPFKLLMSSTRNSFDKNTEIFDWDYIQEQKAKQEWNEKHPNEINPYENLPSIKINTIDINKTFKDISLFQHPDQKMGFDFDLFFEVDDKNTSKFIREKDVDKWLDNMCTDDEKDFENLQTMPYSSKNRDYNHHSLWHLPGVLQANALEKKLKQHYFFKNFKIINTTGNKTNGTKSLTKLKHEIHSKNNPFKTRTITLSCGRLTTGVTVEEWTTILMLSNMTSAQSYMQTIFRCKTPWEFNGIKKTQGIVYDFSPNRVLEILSEYANITSIKRQTKKEQNESESFIKELINYMPVISFYGNSFKSVDCNEIMEGIKKIYIQNIVKNGFDTPDVFNKKAFDDLSIDDLVYYESKISSGHSQSSKLSDSIIINKNSDVDNVQVMVDGQTSTIQINNKVKKIISPEEKEKENRRKNLRLALLKISKRMPLMVIALNPNITDNFKIKDFPKHFDNDDWEEFMQEVTKEDFIKLTEKFFDEVALQGAVKKWCHDIDNVFKIGDFEQQVIALKDIFSRVKNPDKETVLTPWYVIKIHFDRTNINWKNALSENKGKVYIIDINSKSGMYPLYALWSLWNFYERKIDPIEIIKKHIYVNCRTDAARKITRRVLGIRDKKYDFWANNHIIKYDIFKRHKELLEN